MSARPHPSYVRITAGGSWWSPVRPPAGEVEVDWSHPLTKGLKAAGVNGVLYTPEGVATESLGSHSVEVYAGRICRRGLDNTDATKADAQINWEAHLLFAFGDIYETGSDADQPLICGNDGGQYQNRPSVVRYHQDGRAAIYIPWWGVWRVSVLAPTANTWASGVVRVRNYYGTGVTKAWKDGVEVASSTTVRHTGAPTAARFQWGRAGSTYNNFGHRVTHAYAYVSDTRTSNVEDEWSDSFCEWLSAEPYAFLRPVQRRIWVPVSTGGGGGDTLLASAISAALTTSAALTQEQVLKASITALGTTAGVLAVDVALASAATAIVTTAGNVAVDANLAAAISTTVTTTANLALDIDLIASATGIITTAGALTAASGVALSAAVTALVNTSGSVTQEQILAAAANVVVSTTAGLVLDNNLKSAVTASLAASGILNADTLLSGAASAIVTTAGSVSVDVLLASTASLQATLTGSLTQDIALRSAVSAALNAVGFLTGPDKTLIASGLINVLASGILSDLWGKESGVSGSWSKDGEAAKTWVKDDPKLGSWS